VANGATGVSCVTSASNAESLDVVDGLRPEVRSQPGSSKD
jgi:hypothetical protein